MTKFLTTKIGRLRLLGFLEGLSLLVLVFIAVPVKYLGDNPAMVKIIGPIHGALFLLFVLVAIGVAVEQNWKFTKTTWKVIAASFVPFGTFYIDHKILKNLHKQS